MKTLLLFIGTVLRSRIIQRKGLGAVPAIYKLILYWWIWTPPQSDATLQVTAVSDRQEQSSCVIANRWIKPIAQGKALIGLS
jgi:hypothetical protein